MDIKTHLRTIHKNLVLLFTVHISIDQLRYSKPDVYLTQKAF